jgi:ABC-2 type transport system ATP-binding protein
MMALPQHALNAQPVPLPVPPLVMENVMLSYGDTIALADVNLQLPPGAVVGLAGSNGAGKSSLMRCMLGLTVPQSGQISLMGENPYQLSDAARSNIGYVPQTPELIEWMKVGQHLDYIGAFYPDWDAARVARWCTEWQLNPREKVSGLSLGQKQKLSLLLALGHAPQLLVLAKRPSAPCSSPATSWPTWSASSRTWC